VILLRDNLAADHFPLLPRVQGSKTILAKLDPPAPRAPAHPAPRAPAVPNHGCGSQPIGERRRDWDRVRVARFFCALGER